MVQVVGHRGAPTRFPENTIESFKEAIRLGVDFIECDVHMTRDGQIVVIHDDTVNRTTSGKGPVRDFSLAELKNLTISGEYRIPTIEEVLALDFPVFIELKSFRSWGSRRVYPGLAGKLLSAPRKAGSAHDVILLSFDGRYLDQLRGSGFKSMLLFKRWPNLDALKTHDLFGVGVDYRALRAENVNEAHGQSLKVMAWTVDRKKDIERMITSGADFVVSNDPELAIRVSRTSGRAKRT